MQDGAKTKDAGPRDGPFRDGTAEAVRAEVERDGLRFELSLSRRAEERLIDEIRRCENRLAQSEAEKAALRGRLAEREQYLGAIHTSAGWRLLQFVRGLFGRRW